MAKKYTIGMILESPFPPDIRVEKEAKALLSSGYRVKLLCLKAKNDATSTMHQDIECVYNHHHTTNIIQRILYLIYSRISFVDIRWKKALKNFIDNEEIDALHVHDLNLAYTVVKANKEAQLPLVVDFHENMPAAQREYMRWSPWYIKFLCLFIKNYYLFLMMERKVCNNATAIITVVEEMKQRLIEQHNVPAEKIWVVTNTEDVSFVKNANIKQSIIEKYSRYFTVIYAGGFGFHRGLHTMIRGVAIARYNIPNLRVVIVGSKKGDTYKHLEKIKKSLNLDDIVEFTGYRPFNELPGFYMASSVGVVPHESNEHTNNTIPHKIYQYMLCRLPVLVSTCPPLKHVIDTARCGIAFEAGNPDDFAEKLLLLYREPEKRKNMGERGYEATVKGDMNWECTGRKLVALYESIRKK